MPMSFASCTTGQKSLNRESLLVRALAKQELGLSLTLDTTEHSNISRPSIPPQWRRVWSRAPLVCTDEDTAHS
jgi:hypothetical protein